jgi:hypothetical protein
MNEYVIVLKTKPYSTYIKVGFENAKPIAAKRITRFDSIGIDLYTHYISEENFDLIIEMANH